MMFSKISIDKNCVNRLEFSTLTEPYVATGVLTILEGEYRTLSQNQKLTFNDLNIANFGTGVFSIRIICKIGSFVSQSGGTINAIFSKGASETNGFYLGIKSDNKLYAYTVSTGGKIYDTAINDNLYHEIIITRSGTSLVGYVDGVQRLTVTCSAATVNSGSFQIAGDSTTAKYSALNVRLVEIYNKVIASDEVLAIYNNSKYLNYNPIMNIEDWIKGTGTFAETYHTFIPTIFTADWSSGIDGFSQVDCTVTGNNDNISDGVITKDNCLKITDNTNNTTHFSKKTTGISASETAVVSFWYYIPNTNTTLTQLLVCFSSASTEVVLSPASSTKGAWKNVTTTIYKNTTDSGILFIPCSGGSSSYAGTGEYLYISDLTIKTIPNSIMPTGQKIFNCTSSGTMAYLNKLAYGTLEFSWYRNINNTFLVYFIDSDLLANNVSSYNIEISTTRIIKLTKTTITDLFSTAANYTLASTWYRIKITRSITGVFTVYIKGGAFGTNYVLVSVSGGSGTNPVTDNTYTASNFFVIDLDTSDKISDIKIY